jgi:hypothetical protein
VSGITPLPPSYHYLDFSLLMLTLLSSVVTVLLLPFMLMTFFSLVPLSQTLTRLRIVLKNGLKCQTLVPITSTLEWKSPVTGPVGPFIFHRPPTSARYFKTLA